MRPIDETVRLAVALPAMVLLAAGCAGDADAGSGDDEGSEPGPAASGPVASQGAVDCDADDGGLELPDGFCARVVARGVGAARHIAVDAGGDLYVALREDGEDRPGGVVALRDTTGDGRADVRETFGGGGGTGVALRDGWLYFGADGRILRWHLREGELAPSGSPEVVVSDLPSERSHAAKPIVFDGQGDLFVNVGSPSNSCQEEDRAAESPGMDPCPELETRAGIWRFDADATGQTQADGQRFATGMRNTVALALGPDGTLHGVIHGRDQLGQNWPDLFTVEESARKPSEEFVRITEGADYGWPYCYHDPQLDEKVLAPEYGGDGREVGRCADKDDPLVAFPAHWAPDGLHFYTADQFPPEYRGGAFIAFHGSWNRAPEPQAGYKVVHVPFRDGRPTGEWEEFATGFREPGQGPRDADHRPVGLAQGPDGSLYVTDDQAGWIWRIMREGG
jgi:glucose/arabinose dehydrogenase